MSRSDRIRSDIRNGDAVIWVKGWWIPYEYNRDSNFKRIGIYDADIGVVREVGGLDIDELGESYKENVEIKEKDNYSMLISFLKGLLVGGLLFLIWKAL